MRLRLVLIAALAALTGCAQAGSPAPAGIPELHVDCRGRSSASPTVILESGAFGSAADWDLVLDDLAGGGRVCAYDRGGIGRSPARTGDPGVTAIAEELRGLLDRLGERGPVILVGHSNGALYVETFAALWPDRVAGLVYVNGVNSDALDHPDLIADLTTERRLAGLAAWAGNVGLSGQVSDVLTSMSGFSGKAAERKRLDLSDARVLRVARDEDRAVIDGLKIARGLGGSPSAIPMAVVAGSADPDAALSRSWKAAEEAPARRADRQLIIDVPGSTHTSPLVRDRGHVVRAVDWLRSLSAPRVE
ncbi:MAG: alpha/beta fold hydrolase [Caulobacteraceae bacterium]